MEGQRGSQLLVILQGSLSLPTPRTGLTDGLLSRAVAVVLLVLAVSCRLTMVLMDVSTRRGDGCCIIIASISLASCHIGLDV